MLAHLDDAVLGDIPGDIVQVCLVTRDHKRTMDGLMKLGIGPWRIHVFDRDTTSDTHYHGQTHWFSAVMGYASSANMMWEVVEPTGGTSIFEDVLARKGEGVHHLGLSLRGLNFDDAIASFAERGFSVAQSGRVWGGDTTFAFVGTFDELGIYLELTDSAPGFKPPDPDAWYPAPPVKGAAS